MKFHEKLKKAMDEQGLWPAELLRRADLTRSQTTLSAWLEGGEPPRLDDAFKIARALDLSLDYLADDAVSKPQQLGMEMSDNQQKILSLAEKLGEFDVRMILEQVKLIGAAEANRRILLPPMEGQVPPPKEGPHPPRKK